MLIFLFLNKQFVAGTNWNRLDEAHWNRLDEALPMIPQKYKFMNKKTIAITW